MYSSWSYTEEPISGFRGKIAGDSAYQETERRMKANDVVDTLRAELESELPPMICAEATSELFRQRGIPCMDAFTSSQVFSFRRAFGYTDPPIGTIRKFLTLMRWRTPRCTTTMWTIEPVVSTCVVRGNGIDVAAAVEDYDPVDLVVDPVASSSRGTTVSPGNEAMGRWASWVVWRAGLDKGWSNAVCTTCNMSSLVIGFTMHMMGGKMIDLIMTPESIPMLGSYATNMIGELDVSATVSSGTSTRLIIQPSMARGRASSLKVFGNGSLQFCGSPSDIEHLFKALYSILKAVMRAEPTTFLATMRQAGSSAIST
jgi:hypothetical protein